ncbi:TPA: hypothetical protein L5634_001413 [Pseudomonas aeruginosa]|nr:hypothetical protein [Pseudomonas aeruginosa]
MAVTAKSARGAARKPGGAMRRHAQAVLYFQEAIEDQPMTLQLRHETPDDITGHAGLQLPGVPPDYFMALALHGPVPEGIAHYSDAFKAAA